MLLEVLMQYSCIISQKLLPLVRRFRDIKIVIITNSVVSSVDIKRADCTFQLKNVPNLDLENEVNAPKLNQLQGISP